MSLGNKIWTSFFLPVCRLGCALADFPAALCCAGPSAPGASAAGKPALLTPAFPPVPELRTENRAADFTRPRLFAQATPTGGGACPHQCRSRSWKGLDRALLGRVPGPGEQPGLPLSPQSSAGSFLPRSREAPRSRALAPRRSCGDETWSPPGRARAAGLPGTRGCARPALPPAGTPGAPTRGPQGRALTGQPGSAVCSDPSVVVAWVESSRSWSLPWYLVVW